MASPSFPDRPEPDAQASAEEVEADIARTREELAHTVDELTRKLDVKAQAQHKKQEVKDRVGEQVHSARAQGAQTFADLKDTATDDRGQLKPIVPAAAVALAAAVIAVVVWKRRTS
ncbi:DUF3618 domain-containing protein [Dietzia sp. SLG310A2-38A2]|uniref:DUF3618 domain-containing protein n=1 Tax=Dietzia sp. SLG310A2-38A2 TaxID=1630643 RepID=UPI0015F8156F|nr:DUF3618 domain-containing protein [Dietzia sp. SLG310A2-38A2]MBB1029506.1 DUF3618 domain-containing protein [Dietzia sp. SLG310A2-38A2]